MTDINTNCDLDALQDAIIADIKAAFPGFVAVEFYRDERRPMPVPSCLLEMSEFEPARGGDDWGTGQLCVDLTFQARLVVGFRDGKRQIRKLAAAFSAWIHLRQWAGVKAGQARFVSAYPEPVTGDEEAYECWNITWEQPVFLGDTVWAPIWQGDTSTDWEPVPRGEGGPGQGVGVWLQGNIEGEQAGEAVQVAE